MSPPDCHEGRAEGLQEGGTRLRDLPVSCKLPWKCTPLRRQARQGVSVSKTNKRIKQ